MYYKLTIDETGRNSLREVPRRFNTEEKHFSSIEETRKFLVERYGKMPKRSEYNKIFIDGENNTAVEVGFTYSYWNKDYSHNSKSWYQTDWITLTEVHEKPILL